MKTTPSNESDPSLNELLRDWKVRAALPARFEERVWQRIAAHENAAPAQWRLLDWIGSWLAQPRLATGYVTALLLAGFVIGWAHGLERTARVESDLRTRYLQEIDPYRSRSHQL